MHLCTAIAAQVNTLQSLKERVLTCASSIQAGTAKPADVAALQTEFLACKGVLHELRLNTPEYLRVKLGIPSGTEQYEWDCKLCIGHAYESLWWKNTEGYIEKINLSSSIITDAGLALLPRSVTEVNLGSCINIEAPDLRHYTKLNKINLTYTAITDAGLALLPPSVTEVKLWECKKIEAPDLRQYTKLKEIYLRLSTITDAGLALLPPSVTKLDLRGCQNITKEGVETLQVRLPNCTIYSNFS